MTQRVSLATYLAAGTYYRDGSRVINELRFQA
jgi:hypothetical protein